MIRPRVVFLVAAAFLTACASEPVSSQASRSTQEGLRRVNYLSGVKRGEVTTSDIAINVGLRKQDLEAQPADFAPDIPRR